MVSLFGEVAVYVLVMGYFSLPLSCTGGLCRRLQLSRISPFLLLFLLDFPFCSTRLDTRSLTRLTIIVRSADQLC